MSFSKLSGVSDDILLHPELPVGAEPHPLKEEPQVYADFILPDCLDVRMRVFAQFRSGSDQDLTVELQNGTALARYKEQVNEGRFAHRGYFYKLLRKPE